MIFYYTKAPKQLLKLRPEEKLFQKVKQNSGRIPVKEFMKYMS